MNLQAFDGSVWMNGNQTGIMAVQTGQYVEFRIPLANIGSPSKIYLLGAMINEQAFSEWTYHLTPTLNGSDGYNVGFSSFYGFPLTTGISPDDPVNVNALLPVELTSFSATTIRNDVKLSWKTVTEVNNYGFEIERSVLNSEWYKIGFVNGNGNSNSPKDYSFVDTKVNAGKYSYRLKQIDNDGKFEYSKTIEIDVNNENKFELSRNYPNPFNPVTTIQFRLPQTGLVKLTLFNILGQEVRTLVNEFMEAGMHSVNFNASELNSGIYIYKLESGSFNQTKKMTIIK